MREAVLDRDRVCRFSGVAGRLEMNEIESRAKTRGRPAEERFNTRNCVLLTREAHGLFTRGILGIRIESCVEGANGPLIFFLRNWQRVKLHALAEPAVRSAVHRLLTKPPYELRSVPPGYVETIAPAENSTPAAPRAIAGERGN